MLIAKNKRSLFYSRQRPLESSTTPEISAFNWPFKHVHSHATTPNKDLNSFKGLPSSCSWSKSRVKRPGWCTLYVTLRGVKWKTKHWTGFSPKCLWPQQPTTLVTALGVSTKLPLVRKSLEELIMSLRFPLKSLLPSLLFNWAVIYLCSVWMFGIILLYAMLFSANLTTSHSLNWDSGRMPAEQTKQPFIVRQHWYHPWSAQGLNSSSFPVCSCTQITENVSSYGCNWNTADFKGEELQRDFKYEWE